MCTKINLKIMHGTVRFIIVFALAFLMHGTSKSAEFVSTQDAWGDPLIEIRGEILAGDLSKVRKIAAGVVFSQTASNRKPLKFHLNTPGGDVGEAMKIGQFFRDILANVESYGNIIYAEGSQEERDFIFGKDPNKIRDLISIPIDATITDKDIVKNYSAGVLIFLGAVKRAHRDNSDQRHGFLKQKSIPVMGIHRPYYAKEFFGSLSPAQAQEAYRNLEAAVRKYMLGMGASQHLVDRMFLTASNEIQLIPADDFRKLYNEEEVFLQEWLIAKCGVTGAQNALNSDEYSDYIKIEACQTKSRMQDQSAAEKQPLYVYPTQEFPSPYPEDLYRKVRFHNHKVHACDDSAVVNHQLEWANSLRR